MLQAPLLKLSRAKDDQHEVVQQKKPKKLPPTEYPESSTRAAGNFLPRTATSKAPSRTVISSISSSRGRLLMHDEADTVQSLSRA